MASNFCVYYVRKKENRFETNEEFCVLEMSRPYFFIELVKEEIEELKKNNRVLWISDIYDWPI